MYLKACRRDDLVEGGLELAAVAGRLVVIVWPKGGTPRAFQGFCPHAREPLADGRFAARPVLLASLASLGGRVGR
jgi:toluene 4-monooxygenase protein C (EC 1.14.13.-)